MKRSTSIIILFLAGLFLAGCDSKTVESNNNHLSQNRLTRIDTMVNGYINSGKLSGATVLISRNNEVAYLKSYGYSNIDDRARM